MKFRDLIEHNVRTSWRDLDPSDLALGDVESAPNQGSRSPVPDLGVFDSPTLELSPDTSTVQTPGATARGLQPPAVLHMYERFIQAISGVGEK
ncbi:MAG: hypothetical protein WAU68_16455 [Vitreimonas sp.]